MPAPSRGDKTNRNPFAQWQTWRTALTAPPPPPPLLLLLLLLIIMPRKALLAHTVGHQESLGRWGKLHAAPPGVLPLPAWEDHHVQAGRTALMWPGGLQRVPRGQQQHHVAFLLHRRILQVWLDMTSDQQVRHRDGGRHAGHSGWDERWAATGHAEQQGHWNVRSTLPMAAQVQGHTRLHQREWRHQMCRGGTLPKDIAGHDSLPHDSQQDAAFRERPASPVTHLQLHTSQHHWHGPWGRG